MINVSPDLNHEQRNELERCIFEYQDIFTAPGGTLGHTGIVTHSIDTGDTKHIRIPPRRIPITPKHVMDTEIDKMLENKIIEPSSSPWASPILLVTKKDGTIRFCVD